MGLVLPSERYHLVTQIVGHFENLTKQLQVQEGPPTNWDGGLLSTAQSVKQIHKITITKLVIVLWITDTYAT